MNIHPLHTVICTDKLVKTVNFYEDFFEFVPVFETEDHVIMQRGDDTKSQIAIIDVNHASLPEGFRNVTSGLMLSFPVDDIQKSYEHFYYEGVDMASELAMASCGQNFFMMKDPNNNLITLTEKERTECVTLINNERPLETLSVTQNQIMAS